MYFTSYHSVRQHSIYCKAAFNLWCGTKSTILRLSWGRPLRSSFTPRFLPRITAWQRALLPGNQVPGQGWNLPRGSRQANIAHLPNICGTDKVTKTCPQALLLELLINSAKPTQIACRLTASNDFGIDFGAGFQTSACKGELPGPRLSRIKFCDYQKRYPLPRIADLLRDLSKERVYTRDLRSAYNRIRLRRVMSDKLHGYAKEGLFEQQEMGSTFFSSSDDRGLCTSEEEAQRHAARHVRAGRQRRSMDKEALGCKRNSASMVQRSS
ncbi:hypothetical protein BASA60_009114 [Batrachochytrium salamandrivorans]|nr:hypothetical protein BASA60_009114 [Batrachochytrium salamandrivorans]